MTILIEKRYEVLKEAGASAIERFDPEGHFLLLEKRGSRAFLCAVLGTETGRPGFDDSRTGRRSDRQLGCPPTGTKRSTTLNVLQDVLAK